MFKHIYITRLKCLLREKSLVFWTLIFPIALGTFFNLAFSNLNAAEAFEPINLAIVKSKAFDKNTGFKDLIHSLSQDNDDQIFKTQYTDLEKAEKLLKDQKISGYIVVDDKINLHIINNGYKQTIIKSVVDQYLQISSAVENIVEIKPDAIKNGILNELNKNYIDDKTNNNMDVTVIYFYTLIGMMCMYAGFWGIKTVNESQANLTPLGARVSIVPTPKGKILLTSLLASLTIELVEVLIVLAYLIFVLGVDFGDKTSLIILTSFIGSCAGISYGAMISSITTKSEDAKTAILIITSMILSFLAGMMYMDIRYLIATNVPLLAYINPVSVITDALYATYYYTTNNRFIFDIILLIIFTGICCLTTYIFIRRRRYESI